MAFDSTNVTVLLRRLADGDNSARDDFYRLVYPELRRLAARYLSRERPDHTLQPTALVNEAFLRLPGSGVDWHGRSHFFAVAATIMRRILVDHARGLLARKRAAGQRIELSDNLVYNVQRPEHMVELDEALNRLGTLQERQAKIVEMRFFGGLNEEEIADVLSMSVRTVRRDWQIARAFLYTELTRGS